jgi:hypothetical protein
VKKIDAWFNGGCMKAVTHISLLDDVVLKMIGEMNKCIKGIDHSIFLIIFENHFIV